MEVKEFDSAVRNFDLQKQDLLRELSRRSMMENKPIKDPAAREFSMDMIPSQQTPPKPGELASKPWYHQITIELLQQQQQQLRLQQSLLKQTDMAQSQYPRKKPDMTQRLVPFSKVGPNGELKCLICSLDEHTSSECPYMAEVPKNAIVGRAADMFCKVCDGLFSGRCCNHGSWKARLKNCMCCWKYGEHWTEQCLHRTKGYVVWQ